MEGPLKGDLNRAGRLKLDSKVGSGKGSLLGEVAGEAAWSPGGQSPAGAGLGDVRRSSPTATQEAKAWPLAFPLTLTAPPEVPSLPPQMGPQSSGSPRQADGRGGVPDPFPFLGSGQEVQLGRGSLAQTLFSRGSTGWERRGLHGDSGLSNERPLKQRVSDFPGGPGVKTPCSQSRGHEFDPWLGKVLPALPHVTAKNQPTNPSGSQGCPGGPGVKIWPSNTGGTVCPMGEEIPHASWPKRKPPTQSLPCRGSQPNGIPSIPRGYLTSGDVVGTGEVGCYWLLGVRDATPHSTAHRTPPQTKDDPPNQG